MAKEDYMDDLHLRIARVTDDLRSIQRELNCAAMQAPSDPELMEALNTLSETEPIETLRSSLDQMRHFLWFYGQILTGEPAVSEHLRQRPQAKRPVAAVQPSGSEKTAWPSETTLIRMLADGRNRKPN